MVENKGDTMIPDARMDELIERARVAASLFSEPHQAAVFSNVLGHLVARVHSRKSLNSLQERQR
jgi:hypothetical protein